MAVGMDFYDNYFDNNIDVRNRRLFLHGDIDEDNIGKLVKGLYILESNNAEKPIEIVISSCGGDEYEMFAAYDVIKNCSCHVTTIAVGKIMSAAPLIFAAGDERIAYENTIFMIHESAYGIEAKHTDIKTEARHFEEIENKWCELMAEHTKLTTKQWKQKYNAKPDVYFNVEQAIKYGLVDKVIGKK